jgi:hypothetical protein
MIVIAVTVRCPAGRAQVVGVPDVEAVDPGLHRRQKKRHGVVGVPDHGLAPYRTSRE